MANQRYVNVEMWADEYFSELTPNEKLVYIYLFTNPLVRLSGAYKIAIRQVAFDTGINQRNIEQIFAKLNLDGKLIYRNGWMVLLNFLKNQKLNDNMRKNVISELEKTPSFVNNLVVTVIETNESLSNPFKPFRMVRKEEREIEVEIEIENEIENPSSTKAEGQPIKKQAQEVFDFWKESLNHPKSIFDKKRETRIRARLKDGFTVEELKSVCLGVSKSAWHMGENPDGKVFDAIETIYRDVSQVEKFIELSKIQGSRVNGSNSNGRYGQQNGKQSNADIAQQWADRLASLEGNE